MASSKAWAHARGGHPWVQVITISGRTIKKEAQASPERAEVAIHRINALLDRLPKDLVARGQEFRQQRRQQAKS